MPRIFSRQPQLLQTERGAVRPADTGASPNKPVAVILASLFSEPGKNLADFNGVRVDLLTRFVLETPSVKSVSCDQWPYSG